MIRDQRRQLLEVLSELSEVAPDVRFGQLVANLSYLGRGLSAEAIWDIEDAELARAAREHLEELRTRNQATTVS